MDMKQFRKHLAQSKPKLLREAPSNAYARNLIKNLDELVAAMKKVHDNWDDLVDSASTNSDLIGTKDYPFVDEPGEALRKLKRWAENFKRELKDAD